MTKHLYRFLMFLLGGIFGIQGCGDSSPAAEYGMPYASYKVSGTVVTASNHTPLQGIQLKLGSSDSGQTSGPVLTDATGKWSIQFGQTLGDFFYCADRCALQIDDVDGTDNLGEFANKTVALPFQQTDNGGANWYRGTFEQQDIEIELEPKK